MNKELTKATKSFVACYSFKGHDFFEAPSGTKTRRWAKKVARRASRRLGKALCSAD